MGVLSSIFKVSGTTLHSSCLPCPRQLDRADPRGLLKAQRKAQRSRAQGPKGHSGTPSDFHPEPLQFAKIPPWASLDLDTQHRSSQDNEAPSNTP